MRRDYTRASDQHAVWSDIDAKSQRFQSHSETDAMSAIYEKVEPLLKEIVHQLRPQEGQVGAAVYGQGHLLGIEFFDHPETLKELLPKLLRGYALDAIDPALSRAREAPPPEPFLERVLVHLETASWARFKALGEGEDARLIEENLENEWAGGALLARRRIVHLHALRSVPSPAGV